jgi:hypothetical protein
MAEIEKSDETTAPTTQDSTLTIEYIAIGIIAAIRIIALGFIAYRKRK